MPHTYDFHNSAARVKSFRKALEPFGGIAAFGTVTYSQTEVELDGRYTPDQLRALADALDSAATAKEDAPDLNNA